MAIKYISALFFLSISYYVYTLIVLLDVNKTVFETIDDLAVGDIRKQVRGLLGSFLFGGEDIDKKVRNKGIEMIDIITIF